MTPTQLTQIQNIMTGIGLVPVVVTTHYRPGIKAPVIDVHGTIVPGVFYFTPNNVNFILQLSFENGAILPVIPTFNHLVAAGLMGQYPLTKIGGSQKAGYYTIRLCGRINPNNMALIATTLTGMVGFVHANI